MPVYVKRGAGTGEHGNYMLRPDAASVETERLTVNCGYNGVAFA